LKTRGPNKAPRECYCCGGIGGHVGPCLPTSVEDLRQEIEVLEIKLRVAHDALSKAVTRAEVAEKGWNSHANGTTNQKGQ
jgi:hypothetical protein